MQHDEIKPARKRGRPKKRIYGATYDDLGITRQDAMQYRRMAEIPEDVFMQILSDMRNGLIPNNRGALLSHWDMMNQRHKHRLPASLDTMANILRQHGYTVFEPESGNA